MGLDKEFLTCLNRCMMKFSRFVRTIFSGRLSMAKEARKSPIALERERFMSEMKDQLLELKEKGLGIAVFTL